MGDCIAYKFRKSEIYTDKHNGKKNQTPKKQMQKSDCFFISKCDCT